MSDDLQGADWSTLEPTPSRRRRIEGQVFSWLEAYETSIVAEWLRLVRIRPLAGLGYATAAALSLLLLSPVGWIVAGLLA